MAPASRTSRILEARLTRRLCAILLSLMVFVVVLLAAQGDDWGDTANAQSSVRPPAGASLSSGPPADGGGSAAAPARLPRFSAGGGPRVAPVTDPTAGQGARYDKEIWGEIRNSREGLVSIPDKKSGLLVQSDGWEWMKLRNGPLPRYGGWALGGILVALALFFLVAGRIKIKSGWSGRTIPRFSTMERAAHWLLALSFIILALTGLNVLYGKALLMPLIGKPVFASLSLTAKLLHNYVAFAFMVGLAMTFLMWVWQNFPNRHDVMWLLKLGGLLSKGGHVSAKKFNAGQKILFWMVMISGLSVSLSGISLMFPFQTDMFAKTFVALNVFGAGLPTVLSPVQEMQYASTWHAIMALFMCCLILAHIYIGTIGMQGAFSAMGSGQVDVNWAKEHHDIWAEEVIADAGLDDAPSRAGRVGSAQPAE